MERWKVVYETRHGYFETHTDDMTYDEAVERHTELSEYFPDISYHVEPYEHVEQEENRRVYNNNAIDGWNDLYPSRDEDY
jgi:hypothetical protein